MFRCEIPSQCGRVNSSVHWPNWKSTIPGLASVTSNCGSFLFPPMGTLRCGSSWKLSCSKASSCFRNLLALVYESRTRRWFTSLPRARMTIQTDGSIL